jgi:hypothetical protein
LQKKSPSKKKNVHFVRHVLQSGSEKLEATSIYGICLPSILQRPETVPVMQMKNNFHGIPDKSFREHRSHVAIRKDGDYAGNDFGSERGIRDSEDKKFGAEGGEEVESTLRELSIGKSFHIWKVRHEAGGGRWVVSGE